MQDYDVVLKLLLKGSASATMRALGGVTVSQWLDVELPKVQNLRLDLLGETAGGGLIHVELQSTNDAAMPARMAEYYLGVYRLFTRFPEQVLLYVGNPPARMDRELRSTHLSFNYRLVDIREIDGEQLIESDGIGDNVIAVLARLRDHKSAIRGIVKRIAKLGARERETALAQLFILAGLRRAAKIVEEEAAKMPIQTSILEHDVLGPLFQKGKQEGRSEGRSEGLSEGRLKGRHEGELVILRRQIETRFGNLPGWASEKLSALTPPELEDLSVKILDARSLDELLR